MNTTDTQELAQIIAASVATAVIAYFDGAAPAADAPKADAPKAPKARKALTPAQRKAWNTKFGALLRACPAGSYREAMNRWDEAKAMREAGKTPAQARTAMGFKVSR